MFSFDAKPAAATTGFGFGQPAAPSPGMTGFGGQPSMFAAAPSAAPLATLQASAQPSAAAVSSFSAHPFQYIQQCYDPSNLNYRFRTYFYNRVEGGVAKYARPKPAAISDRLWTQIVNDNPDPQQMIPIVANGFEDLKARAGWQDDQMAAQGGKIRDLEDRLGVLLKKADLETTSQLQQIQRQQLKLIKRVLSIMKTFEVAKRAGHRLQPSEEALKLRVQALLQKLTAQPLLDPNSVRCTQFQIQALQDVSRLDVLQPLRHLSFDDPSALEGVLAVLAEQHKGIKALSETLIRDAKDLEIMQYGFQL